MERGIADSLQLIYRRNSGGANQGLSGNRYAECYCRQVEDYYFMAFEFHQTVWGASAACPRHFEDHIDQSAQRA